jgi:nucleoside-diphosphate-sugar epimerase
MNLEKFYKDKKILVTGGAGFIGSNLCKELIKQKAKVTILDNFSTGNLNNLKPIISQVNIIYGDISNPFTCKKVTLNKDIIFHLAAVSSVTQCAINKETCNKINIEGTKNLLNACVKNNIKKIIFSSSAAVYGNRTDKCKESDKLNPESEYAKTKVKGEKLCQEYAQKYNLQTANLRYFNVYGENQNPNGEYSAVVAKFKHNLINNLPITIYGTGKQTRDFIHVNKVIFANLIIAQKENIYGETINIATGKSINLFELINLLENENNIKNKKIKHEPQRADDILNSFADCQKFNKLINI